MGSEKRGKNELNPERGFKVFVYSVIGMVALAVIVGLYVAGSPGKERERKFDSQRLADVMNLAAGVDSYYDRKGRLPADFNELYPNRREGMFGLNDPATDEEYEYEPVGEADYRLCANFDLSTSESEEDHLRPVFKPSYPEFYGEPAVRDWSYEAGRHCFELNAEEGLYRVECGLRNPCPSGQTCAVLPTSGGAVCVPAGKECLAAGCPNDSCTVAESYPVQVFCNKDVGAEPVSGCTLMRHPGSGKVDCYGCAAGICSDPPPSWQPYELDQDHVGIPYSCYETPDGCALAQ